MEFNIYDISDLDTENIDELLESHETEGLSEVEMGLSSGELRQSILDRVREDVRQDEIHFLNRSLEQFELNINEELLENEDGKNMIVQDVDYLIYELSDEELDNTVWEFSFEVIYIGEI